MSTLLKIPKMQIAGFLLLIYLTALWHDFSLSKVSILFLALSSTLISDFIFTKLRHQPSFLLSAALVSGLIIALLTDPNLPLYIPILAGILAMFSKNFLRFSGRHIFNPAGFGLILTSFIFQTGVSWWAVSFQTFPQNLIFFLVLLTPAFVSIKKMRRHLTIFSFLLTYGIIFKNSFFDPTILFFALVMLPEPMTTPYIKKYQIMFGGVVAIAAFLISSVSFADPLITALLLGNLIFLKFL
ncbi:RnfABCDGE type electron transport complex subunit D [Candidatus Daviesbacteria bacterium]|nr:RnfABCDGE type electron transport complex subunit D [Candidatus Daviesbacteria bacterium]